MRVLVAVVLLVGFTLVTHSADAQSVETENGCSGTTDDPCIRSGACSVQGTNWNQTVTITRSDLYDTMGWPGVCDQVHVALVQGNCSPGGAQLGVTVSLQESSQAFIPELVGPLACNAEPTISVPVLPPFSVGVLSFALAACGTALIRRTQRAEHTV
jgi:hypothetical protein